MVATPRDFSYLRPNYFAATSALHPVRSLAKLLFSNLSENYCAIVLALHQKKRADCRLTQADPTRSTFIDSMQIMASQRSATTCDETPHVTETGPATLSSKFTHHKASSIITHQLKCNRRNKSNEGWLRKYWRCQAITLCLLFGTETITSYLKGCCASTLENRRYQFWMQQSMADGFGKGLREKLSEWILLVHTVHPSWGTTLRCRLRMLFLM